MIAGIYARKSTEQNGIADEQKSVARQIEHARQYAQRRGWDVDQRSIFVDDGISGAEFANRPGYVRLLNALKPKPRFQVLIVSDLDRLGRESIETSMAIKTLNQAGVRVFAYLTDTEIKLDSPIDALIVQVQAFGAAIERQKAGQRTYDALVRKAKAGHVTGARVFGYDNVRVDGHVERRINEQEAAVIRKIFEWCAKGYGQIAIAHRLNEERAMAPRAQHGRPVAWASSTVREVLRRPLYKGVVVYNATKKRDTWGRVKAQRRPQSEWIIVPAPALCIVPERLWKAAHARLEATRQTYLRANGGHLHGRPCDGRAAKYLLTGLAKCGLCGGSLEVRSRSHGTGRERTRKYFYACSSYYRRGKAVCPNKLEVPLDATDAEVIAAVQAEVLSPAFVENVVRRLLTRATAHGPGREARRTALHAERATLERELARLVETAASVGPSPAVKVGIKARDQRLEAIDGELSALDQADVSDIERTRLEAIARKHAADWAGLLKRHPAQGRSILAKVLRAKLEFRPEQQRGRRGVRFSAPASIVPLLTGLVPVFHERVRPQRAPNPS
jgi:DNA invertase Pin-like site-specific DNA recombinase